MIRLNNFYKKVLKKNATIAVLGLNPHCETIDKFSEEEKLSTLQSNIEKSGIRFLDHF